MAMVPSLPYSYALSFFSSFLDSLSYPQFIMGLGAFRSAWWRQSRHFGHTHGDLYSALVFDNRGMGRSDKPLCRYSTSEMARDALEMLQQVGWLDQPGRCVNVVGVSMGGMIAQELAWLVPERVNALVLASTYARLSRAEDVSFLENLRLRMGMFVPKGEDEQMSEAKGRLFPQSFIEATDRDIVRLWPTNGDAFAAGKMRKRADVEGFTRKGFLLQAVACEWHRKTKEQLRVLGERVGRGRICVMHGTGDRMLAFHHGVELRGDLDAGRGKGEEGVRWEEFEGCGHVLGWERMEEHNRIVEEMVEKGNRLNREEGKA